MSEAKTYVFGEGGFGSNNMIGLLAPLLQQRGIDPNLLVGMMNNNGFGGQGSWFIWVIFLFFLMGWGRNGFGAWGNGEGNGQLANMLNNDTGRELLMSAIQGNGQAISQLATTLNCDVNALQGAINGLQTQLCNIGNQVGLSSQQVINAIQSGNMQLASSLQSCCCDIRESVTKGNYDNQIATLNQTNTLQSSINSVATGLERGFSLIGYATQQLTCDLLNTFNAGIQKILDGQCAAEKREMTAIINKQNEDLSSYKTAGIIAQLLSPISGALAALKSEVDAIKCKQPDTKVITTPEHYVPVNALVNVPFTLGYGGYGLGCGCGYGLNNYGFTTAF